MKTIKYIQDANSGLTLKMETTVKSPMVIEIKTTLCNEMTVIDGKAFIMPFEIPKQKYG